MAKQKDWEANQEQCAFPKVNPRVKPLKNLILVQYRNSRAQKVVNGLIRLDHGEKDRWENLVVKVVAMGPLAFKTRNLDTGAIMNFEEGPWCKVGDYVRVPSQGADYLFVEPTENELKEMQKISAEADKLVEPYAFKAVEGLSENKYVKFALLEDTNVLASVNHFDAVLNGH